MKMNRMRIKSKSKMLAYINGLPNGTWTVEHAWERLDGADAWLSVYSLDGIPRLETHVTSNRSVSRTYLLIPA